MFLVYLTLRSRVMIIKPRLTPCLVKNKLEGTRKEPVVPYVKTGPTFEASIFRIYSTAQCDSKSRNVYLVVRIPNRKSSILTDFYVGFLIPYRQIPEHYPDYIKTVYFHILDNSSFDIHPTIDEILTASYNKSGVNKLRKPGVAQATRLSMVTPNALSIITAVYFLTNTCINLHASNSNWYITARFTGR